MIKIKVKISIEDKGRKADISIEEADNLSKLVIIDKVFRLFGVDTDIFSIVDEYNRIGKMYSSFFSEVNPIEITPETSTDKNDIKEKLIQGLTENEDELKVTYETIDDNAPPEHIKTGVKIKDDKTKLYRLRYICPACYLKSSMYIYPNSKTIKCYQCHHELDVFSAHPNEFPNHDSFNNYFRAGDYKDRNLSWGD